MRPARYHARHVSPPGTTPAMRARRGGRVASLLAQARPPAKLSEADGRDGREKGKNVHSYDEVLSTGYKQLSFAGETNYQLLELQFSKVVPDGISTRDR